MLQNTACPKNKYSLNNKLEKVYMHQYLSKNLSKFKKVTHKTFLFPNEISCVCNFFPYMIQIIFDGSNYFSFVAFGYFIYYYNY